MFSVKVCSQSEELYALVSFSRLRRGARKSPMPANLLSLTLGLLLSPHSLSRTPTLAVRRAAPVQLSSLMSRAIEVLPPPSAEEAAKIKASWGTWGCGVSEFPWTYSECAAPRTSSVPSAQVAPIRSIAERDRRAVTQ